jgi:hypothetical protein
MLEAPRSSPLIWRFGLYRIGRNLQWNLPDVQGLPEKARNAGKLVYSVIQKYRHVMFGAWHSDVVQASGNSMIYLRGIKKFEYADSLLKPVEFEFRKDLENVPRGGFVVPTEDGEVDPETGIPFETVGERDVAIRRWSEKFRLDPDVAQNDLMYFSRPVLGDEEYHPVCSTSGKAVAFSILTSFPFPKHDTGIGHFSAKRV